MTITRTSPTRRIPLGARWRTNSGRVSSHGLFFRPLGFLLYWLNYLWAGANPTLWHAGNIALQVLCAALVYVLCGELGLSGPASVACALIFGLAGVAAEAVAWIDAGFVMLATAFLLASLILVCRYAITGRRLLLAAALAAGACGILCKETGFSLPFLVGSLVLFKAREQRRRIAIATLFAGTLALALFAYRWWALNGIGGYSARGGGANVLHFSLLRTSDALFLRQWAVLLFPFNWSTPSSLLLRGAIVMIPLLLAAVAWIARPPRRPLLGCAAFIIAAALPVQHLLLLSPDLGGSRTLYLETAPCNATRAQPMATAVRRGMESSTNPQSNAHPAELARSVCVNFGHRIASRTRPQALA